MIVKEWISILYLKRCFVPFQSPYTCETVRELVSNVHDIINSLVSPCSSPLREGSPVTERAELLVIYSDKWVWGLVLPEPYSFKLLWHWCLVWCSPKNCEDRQSNLSTFLHAGQLSWNPNSIYSCFVSLLKPDVTCYEHFLEPSTLSADILWKPGPSCVKSLQYLRVPSVRQHFSANVVLDASLYGLW